MKKFMFLVCLTILWSVTILNSGTTSKYWVAPTTIEEAHYFTGSQYETVKRFPDRIPHNAVVLMDPLELECMSKNIYFEAAVESTAGKLAVAQVTLNRVKSQQFPDTVCSVVYEGKHNKNGFPIRDRCQFSWYCDGKHDTPNKGKMWEESKQIAKYALTNNTKMLDITDGATHYHADYIPNPRWALARQRTLQIDTHIFYNKTKGYTF